MRSRGIMLDWSQQWAQRPTGPLSLAPDRGRPTLDWLVGPCHTALYKGGGGHWLAVRGSPPATHPHLQSLADLQGSAGVTGSAAAATPSTVAALAQIRLRVAALAQISYMASGPGSAPAGDGIHLSPLLSLCSCITCSYTQQQFIPG
jgi:hypothetical protein